MRILVFGPIFPDSFARNVAVTLEAMGHDVRTLAPWRPPDWLPYSARNALAAAAWRGWVGNASSALTRLVRQFEPELVLNCYWDLSPEVVARLRRDSSARLAVWFPDHPANLRRQYLIAAPYHAVFFKARYIVQALQDQLEMPAHYLPECCNPLWHRRVELSEAERTTYGCDLAIAGSLYYYRALLLEPLSTYNLKVWGTNCPPWLASSLRRIHQNRFIAELEKAKALGAARIVLNTLHPAEVGSVNARLFEVAGCGAFQLSEFNDCLSEFFEPDAELVTFRSRRELKDKVKYYLTHEDERRAIADRAYARAHREHTYQQRLQKLLTLLPDRTT